MNIIDSLRIVEIITANSLRISQHHLTVPVMPLMHAILAAQSLPNKYRDSSMLITHEGHQSQTGSPSRERVSLRERNRGKAGAAAHEENHCDSTVKCLALHHDCNEANNDYMMCSLELIESTTCTSLRLSHDQCRESCRLLPCDLKHLIAILFVMMELEDHRAESQGRALIISSKHKSCVVINPKMSKMTMLMFDEQLLFEHIDAWHNFQVLPSRKEQYFTVVSQDQ